MRHERALLPVLCPPPPPPRFHRAGPMLSRNLSAVRMALGLRSKLLVLISIAASLFAAYFILFASESQASSNSYSFDLAENADGSSTAVSLGTVSLGTVGNYWLNGEYVRFDNDGEAESDNLFEIDVSTGTITYIGDGENYEEIKKFNLVAHRTSIDSDDGKITESAAVTVNVTNVAEDPKFVPHRVVSSTDTFDFALESNADGSSDAVKIGTVRVDDQDSDTLEFAITSGNTGGKFSIGRSTGAVTYNGSGESSGKFELTVTVKDDSNDTKPDDTAKVNVTVATPATDRAALKAIYTATAGDGWTKGSKTASTKPWKVDDDTSSLGDWHGVITDSDGRVTHLSLWRNNLAGSMPFEIGHLTKLQQLHLYGNGSLTGALPASIVNLGDVTDIRMDGTNVAGPIPAEIGDMSSLQKLNLDSPSMSGRIPSTVGKLKELKDLSIRDTVITGTIPIEISGLAKLEKLSINSGRLTGAIPKEIGNLTKLTSLSLSGQRLTGPIPEEIENLTKLTYLSLSDNGLCWYRAYCTRGQGLSGPIPSSISKLTALETLYLTNNSLSGTLPSEIGNMANLKFAEFGKNDLTGNVPSTYSDKMRALERLDVGDNLKMAKVLPTELMSIPKMRTLMFGNTDLCAPTTADFVYWLESLVSYEGDYCEIPMSITSSPNSIREDHGIVTLTVRAILDSFLGVVIRTVIEWPQGQGVNPAEEGPGKDYEVIETPAPLVIPAEGTPEGSVTFKIQTRHDSLWETTEEILLSANKEKTVLFVPTPTPDSGGSNTQSNANIKRDTRDPGRDTRHRLPAKRPYIDTDTDNSAHQHTIANQTAVADHHAHSKIQPGADPDWVHLVYSVRRREATSTKNSAYQSAPVRTPSGTISASKRKKAKRPPTASRING